MGLRRHRRNDRQSKRDGNGLHQPANRPGHPCSRRLRSAAHVLIPNGSPVPRPGFSAFIATGATTASTLAAAAANIASPQRYKITAFNFLEER